MHMQISIRLHILRVLLVKGSHSFSSGHDSADMLSMEVMSAESCFSYAAHRPCLSRLFSGGEIASVINLEVTAALLAMQQHQLLRFQARGSGSPGRSNGTSLWKHQEERGGS